jgi:uncharacterized protein (DUF2249 family)
MSIETPARTLDVRWLEPPEPMERIMAALDELPEGAMLRVMIHREPMPLYRALDASGYRHATRFDEHGYFEIEIGRVAEGATTSPSAPPPPNS